MGIYQAGADGADRELARVLILSAVGNTHVWCARQPADRSERYAHALRDAPGGDPHSEASAWHTIAGILDGGLASTAGVAGRVKLASGGWYVPGAYHRLIVLGAERRQRAGREPEQAAAVGGQAQPASGKYPQQVAVGDERDVSAREQRPDPAKDPIGADADLVDGLARVIGATGYDAATP